MKLLSIVIYFLLIFIFFIRSSNKPKTSIDFILGNKNLNSVTTALSILSAEMSGWLIMVLPGVVFLNGVSEIWHPIGLICGSYLNWQFVAKKIRLATHSHNKVTTIPNYLSNKLNDPTGLIKITATIIATIFFIIYISSSLSALSLLINTFINTQYSYCLLMSGLVIIFYTGIGGFTAITHIDVLQSFVVLFVLFIVPSIAIISSYTNIIDFYFYIGVSSINIRDPLLNINIINLISLLSWGLGYFGQPHILVRFIAIKNYTFLNLSKKIYITWMILSFIAVFYVGFVGRLLFCTTNIVNSETILLLLLDKVSSQFFSGIALASILSVVISSAAAQLHSTTSCLTEDIISSFFKKVNKILCMRIMMLLIIIISMILSSNPNNTILSLVSLAWAGFGSSFGPVILFSLYSNITISSVFYGMITGSVTVVIWYLLKTSDGIFSLYEIVPGFMISSFVIFILNNLFHKK